jgi:pimeloyl-ACP methyl ester carboxylesterase
MERKKIIMMCTFASLFIGFLIIQSIMYNSNRTTQNVVISGTYTSVDYSDPIGFYTNIKIVKSIDYDEGVQHPAVILLHGDGSNSRFFNNIQIELLRFGYCLALIDVSYFSMDIFLYLNETLNYLLEQPDIDPDRIGVLGHSHGAHYGTLFSTMRNESINAVVCANWGNYDYWYDDYYPYYRNFVAKNGSLSTSYSTFKYNNGTLQLPMNLNSQSNLLMVSDRNDNRPDLPLEDYLMNYTENVYNQANVFYGDFSDGSARELIASNSMFGHGSSLFLPDALYKEIEWFNLAFNIDPTTVYSSPNIQITFLNFISYFGFLTVALLLISGIGFIGQILPDIVNQKKSLKSTYMRLLNKRLENHAIQEQNKELEQAKENSQSLALIQAQTTISDDMILKRNDIATDELNKKFVFSIIFLAVIFSIYMFIKDFILPYSNVYYNLENLPIYILGSFGFESWQLNMFFSNFPFSLMFFWIIGLFIMDYKLLKGVILKLLFGSSLKSLLYELILGVEIYILLFLVFRTSFDLFLGGIIEPIYLRNLLFGIFVFYFIFRGYSSIYLKIPNKSGKYLKAVLLNVVIYSCFFLPETINYGLSTISFHLLAIVFLSLMNPHLLEKRVPILVLSLINFFGFIFFSAIL